MELWWAGQVDHKPGPRNKPELPEHAWVDLQELERHLFCGADCASLLKRDPASPLPPSLRTEGFPVCLEKQAPPFIPCELRTWFLLPLPVVSPGLGESHTCVCRSVLSALSGGCSGNLHSSVYLLVSNTLSWELRGPPAPCLQLRPPPGSPWAGDTLRQCVGRHRPS